MGKLIVEIPDELHIELKKKAAANNKTLRNIINELINEYLYINVNEKSVKQKTGLCGAWTDERDADSIIKEIKANRRWFTKNKK